MFKSDDTLPAVLFGYVSALGLKQIWVELTDNSLVLAIEMKPAMVKENVFIPNFI
jgi:hypothetical protein